MVEEDLHRIPRRGWHELPFKGRKDEWLTPPEIISALTKKPFGEFDLDPCSPIVRPWPTAKKHYTIKDDGLFQPWEGRVWMNPPYGPQTKEWMAKFSEHGNGCALIFARTETNIFFKYVWNKADGVLFLKGRLCFYNVDGTKGRSAAPSPSVLVAYGEQNVDCIFSSGINGQGIILHDKRYVGYLSS